MSRHWHEVLSLLLLMSSGAIFAADSPSISFDGQAYSLQSKTTSPSEVLNEYIPTNQSFDAWTRLIAVRRFPELTDQKAAASNLIKALLAQFPQAPYAAWQSDDGQSIGVDFVTAQGDMVEFNVFIYRPHPSGKGLLSQQFAMRAYGDDRLPFMQSLDTTRPDMLKKVIAFQFPDVIEK